jgi:DNA-binding GntR family transcriptional regulator
MGVMQTVIDSIKDKIESGEWPPGFQLPSTSQLEAQFGCSESTVYSAMRELKAMGLIISVHGKGRFVAPRPNGRRRRRSR